MTTSFHPFRLSHNEPGQPMLQGSSFIRGDSCPLRIYIVEPGQESATFRFVAKVADEHPNGTPLIVKNPEDFTVTITGSVLQADFEILPAETTIFQDKVTLIYDLERTIGSQIKTLEQGRFSVIPDVAA